VIRCPGCSALALARRDDGLACGSCRRTVRLRGGWLDLLDAEPASLSLGRIVHPNRQILMAAGCRSWEERVAERSSVPDPGRAVAGVLRSTLPCTAFLRACFSSA
jgi:hypothetical protein